MSSPNSLPHFCLICSSFWTLFFSISQNAFLEGLQIMFLQCVWLLVKHACWCFVLICFLICLINWANLKKWCIYQLRCHISLCLYKKNLNEVFAFSKGKIPEMLSSGSVDSQTKLIVVNALYFQGTWFNCFDKEFTIEMPFKINKVRNSILRLLLMW